MTSTQRFARSHDLAQPTGVRKVVPPTEAEQLDAFAALAAGDAAEGLFVDFERAAIAILDAQGSVTAFEVRFALGRLGKLANDGKETLDAIGGYFRRMGLEAARDGLGNVVRERPPEAIRQVLIKSHANLNTRWIRPRARLLGPVERMMR